MDIRIDSSEPGTRIGVNRDTRGGVDLAIPMTSGPAKSSLPAKFPKFPMPAKTAAPPARHHQQTAFKAPIAEVQQTLLDFANPRRTKDQSEDEFPDIPEEGSEDDSVSEHPSSEYSVADPPDDHVDPDSIPPSSGFITLEDEKSDLIWKLSRVKAKGMPSLRTFSMASDIREMRAELARVHAEIDMEASINFQRSILIGMTTGVELLNTRYDPFDLQLNGWSDSVRHGIGSYDRVFERLHEKYKNKVAVAPEIELLLMIGSSALMFHVTASITKAITGGSGGPGGSGIPGLGAGGINPGMMSGLMSMFAKKPDQAQEAQDPQQAQHTQQAQDPQQVQRGPVLPRREMKGPGNMFPAMPILQQSSDPPPPPPMSTQGKGKRVRFDRDQDDQDDQGDDRMSDLVSEDLELDSVPDDMSMMSEIVTVKTGGRGGGKKAKNAKTKNVIKLI